MTTATLNFANSQFGTKKKSSLATPSNRPRTELKTTDKNKSLLSASSKRARMELKTTDAAKELLSMAATLDGTDLTAFILNTAMERARKVVSEHSSILLNRDGQEALARLLQAAPSQPTKTMQELMSLPDLSKA